LKDRSTTQHTKREAKKGKHLREPIEVVLERLKALKIKTTNQTQKKQFFSSSKQEKKTLPGLAKVEDYFFQ